MCLLLLFFGLFVCFCPALLSKLTAPDVDDNGGFLGFFFFLIIYIFFYQWFARDAIVVAVTLQFLMVSKVSFVFSSAKGTLSIMQ